MYKRLLSISADTIRLFSSSSIPVIKSSGEIVTAGMTVSKDETEMKKIIRMTAKFRLEILTFNQHEVFITED